MYFAHWKHFDQYCHVRNCHIIVPKYWVDLMNAAGVYQITEYWWDQGSMDEITALYQHLTSWTFTNTHIYNIGFWKESRIAYNLQIYYSVCRHELYHLFFGINFPAIMITTKWAYHWTILPADCCSYTMIMHKRWR